VEKNVFNYLNWTLISIQHFCISLNQIIDHFRSFKFLTSNSFKFQIHIESNSAFVILVKLGHHICQNFYFYRLNCPNFKIQFKNSII